jgi:hypothetical protein
MTDMVVLSLNRASQTRVAMFAVLMALGTTSIRAEELSALDGEWIYVEDRTEGRELEQMGPPMSATFSMRSEAGASSS